jgi:hypothetical protein
MDRMAKSPENGWRQLTACVLVFALILQGVAFTLAGARLAAADPADTAAGFELCRHDGGTAGGGAPESPGADSHCIFCLAGATYLDAPAAAASEFHTITFAVLSWSFSAWRLPAATVNASARPRGPPLIA